MPHVQDATTRLAHHRESLGENLGEDFVLHPATLVVVFDVLGSFLNSRPEFVRFRAQFGIAEPLHFRLERADILHIRHRALDFALIFGAENLT